MKLIVSPSVLFWRRTSLRLSPTTIAQVRVPQSSWGIRIFASQPVPWTESTVEISLITLFPRSSLPVSQLEFVNENTFALLTFSIAIIPHFLCNETPSSLTWCWGGPWWSPTCPWVAIEFLHTYLSLSILTCCFSWKRSFSCANSFWPVLFLPHPQRLAFWGASALTLSWTDSLPLLCPHVSLSLPFSLHVDLLLQFRSLGCCVCEAMWFGHAQTISCSILNPQKCWIATQLKWGVRGMHA